MHSTVASFISREGSLTILSNLAAHFEFCPVHDEGAREYLMIEARRLIAAIASDIAVID